MPTLLQRLPQHRHLDAHHHRDVPEALAFIRLVVANNPDKTASQITARSDVQEAVVVIDRWIFSARLATGAMVAQLPPAAQEAIDTAAGDTISKIDADTQIEERIGEWRSSDESPEAWAAKMVLRMRWFSQWLEQQAQLAALEAPYKLWVSRLDKKTCKFCRGLHGTVLPATASFAATAGSLGYSRVYGGLLAPPLHPHCRCRLEPGHTFRPELTNRN